MKRLIALLMCLVMVVCVIASCGEPEEAHSHTYSETWSSDAVGHWYKATCDCEDAPEQKFSHVDKNNDGACDVCEYKMACADGHTYSEGWTVDCTNHWNAADCGHIVAGANVAEHVDTNNDGECDVCKYVINEIHVHYFDTAWTNDGEYHWHAALCEHGVEVADKTAHVLNAAGYCTVCEAKINEVDPTDLAAILAAAVARNDKVAYGDVIATEAVYGGTGAETLENGKTNKVHFALGNGESYIQYISFDMYGDYIGQNEQWYEDLGNGEVFGAEMVYGEYELAPIAGAAQFLNGYNYIPGSIIPSDSADTSTLANMLIALYNQMKAGVRVSNATESVENGVYAFSYTYYSINVSTAQGAVFNVELEYYNVDVEFTVNDDLIIDTANFQVEVYRDYENDSDLDYTYTDNGDGTVTLTADPVLKATANPSYYTYSVAQMSGERTFTTPYPRASLLPSSFELLLVTGTVEDENGNKYPDTTEPIGETVEFTSGTYALFAIGDILPVTASSKFINTDDFTFEFVNNDPDSDGRAWYMDAGTTDAMINGYSAYTGMLKLMLRDEGEYTVTVGFGEITQTFTLKVTAKPVTEITGDANSISVKLTDFYTYDNDEQSYVYTATAEGNYTFTIPAGLGARLDGEDNAKVDFTNSPNGGTFTVGLNEGESVKIYFAAANSNTYNVTVAYVYADIPDSEVGGGEEEGGESGTVGNIVGTYYSGNEVLVINEDGTITFTAVPYVYTYVINDGVVTYTYNGGFEYTADNGMAIYFGYLTFDSNGMPATFVCNGGTVYELTTTPGGSEGGDQPGGEEPGDEPEQNTNDIKPTEADGNFTVKVTDTYTWDDEYNFTAPVAGTYTFTIPAGLGLYTKNSMDSWGDAEVNYYENVTGAAFSIELTEGQKLTFYVGSLETGTYTIEFTDDEDKIVYPSVGLWVGENEITVLPGQLTAGVTCTLSCWEPGDYTFTLEGATITVYNSLGEVMATGTGSATATLDSYRNYTIVVVPTAAGTVTLDVSVAYPEGSSDNPEVITIPTTVDVNLPGNYTAYYYTFTATETGRVTFTFANANVVVTLGYDEIASGDTVVVIAGTTYVLNVYADDAQTDTMTVAFEAAELTESDWFSLVAGEYYLKDDSTLTINADGTIVRSYMSYVTWENLFEYSYTGALTVGEDGTITIVPTPVDGAPALGNITLVSDEGYYVISVEGIYSSIYAGEIEVEVEENDQDGTNYSYIAEEEGTLTITIKGASMYNAETGEWEEVPAAYLNMMLARGGINFAVNGTDVRATTTTVELTVGGAVTIKIASPTGQALQVTLDVVYTAPESGDEGEEGGSEGGMTGSGTSFDPYIITTLPAVLTEGPEHDVYCELTVPTDGTLVITYTQGGLITGLPADAVKDAAAMTWTVEVTAGQVVKFNPWTMGALESYTYTITLTEKQAAPGITGSGTKDDPYVIPALPAEITLGSKHDVYVTYTATETQTIVITYPAGCYVSDLPGDAVKDSTAQTYTFTLAAGTTLKFNPWTMGTNEAYTYKFEVAAPTTPDEGGEGGEGGDTPVAGETLSWVGANGSGRAMKVTINKAAGTMSIIRAALAGNSLDTATGATEATYTYSFDGTTVTYACVSGQSCTVTFDAEGNPVSVVWGTATYTGFVLEA